MDYHINESEYRLMDILWDVQPINSMELVGLCGERLGWKKSTTYTVLRRLCQKGIFQNEGGVVTARISREEFDEGQSRAFVDQAFDGSLPKLLAAFTSRQKLSAEEVEQLQRLIDQNRE